MSAVDMSDLEPPAQLLGEDVIAVVPVRAGTTACACSISTLSSGRTVFVKRPLDDET